MNPEDNSPKPLLFLHFQKEIDTSQNLELKYRHAYSYSRKYNNRKYNVYKFHKKR